MSTIFIYPAGLIAADGKISWYTSKDPRDRLRDFALFDALLAQNGLEPPSRLCEPRDLNCECYGQLGTPNPVFWCPHTEDNNCQGKFYPHLWPKEASAVIMDFFDSLPAPAQ